VVAEADLLYRGKIVVWIHGGIHTMPHVQARDAEQKRKLKALGYRIVEIWSDNPEEGMAALAQWLGRMDLVR
jgi:very-short-patch-repair endonuclease